MSAVQQQTVRPLASIPRRVLARFVDLLILFVPAIVAVVAIRPTAVGLPTFFRPTWPIGTPSFG